MVNSESVLRLPVPIYFTFTLVALPRGGVQLLFAVPLCRVETREEKKERRKREKAEQVAYKLEQVQLFSFADFSESVGESCVICACIC